MSDLSLLYHRTGIWERGREEGRTWREREGARERERERERDREKPRQSEGLCAEG